MAEIRTVTTLRRKRQEIRRGPLKRKRKLGHCEFPISADSAAGVSSQHLASFWLIGRVGMPDDLSSSNPEEHLTGDQLKEVARHVRENVKRIACLKVFIQQMEQAGDTGTAAAASELLSRLERVQTLALEHLRRAPQN